MWAVAGGGLETSDLSIDLTMGLLGGGHPPKRPKAGSSTSQKARRRGGNEEARKSRRRRGRGGGEEEEARRRRRGGRASPRHVYPMRPDHVDRRTTRPRPHPSRVRSRMHEEAAKREREERKWQMIMKSWTIGGDG